MRELDIGVAEFVSLAREVLARDGLLRFRAAGRSMEPFVRDGDVLTIQRAEAEDLAVGDIALYVRGETRPVVHRVVGLPEDGNGIVIQGDAHAIAERVLAGRILGRVISVDRGGREISLDGLVHTSGAMMWHRFRPVIGLVKAALRAPVHGAVRVLRALQRHHGYRRALRRYVRTRVAYREATEEDAAELARVYGGARVSAGPLSARGLARRIRERPDGTRFVVATVSGRVVGAAIIAYHGNQEARREGWWLYSVQVRLRWRGAGVGEGLTQTAMRLAKRLGAPELWLIVDAGNAPAIHMYRKLGFQDRGLAPGASGRATGDQARPRRMMMSRDLSALALGGD